MESIKKDNNIGYIDIYAKELLNEIKSRVRQNTIELTNEEDIDRKMIEVIKELCNGQYVKSSDKEHVQFSIVPSGTEEDTERVICTLIMYYTAMYFNNLKLLNKLLEKGYNFGRERYRLSLCVLYKRISSSFEEDEYLDLVMNRYPVLESFYRSLIYDKSSKKSDEEYIKIFSEILKANPKIADRKNNGHGVKVMSDLITKATIDTFGKEIILTSSYEQRDEIIDEWRSWSYLSEPTEEERERLINLMINNGLSMNVSFRWYEICARLSDEEILEIQEYRDKYNKNLYFECRNDTGIDYEAIKKILKREHKKLKKYFKK